MSCKECEEKFDLLLKSFKRELKKGREPSHFFCSRSCATSWKNKNLPKSQRWLESNRRKMIGNDHSKQGEFTWYLKQVRKREPRHQLSEEFLQDLWNEQCGKCAASGIEMEKRHNSNKHKHHLWTASLDRKDSEKGYTRDNVQFLAYGLNLAKNTFTDSDLWEFLNMIKRS